MPEIYSLVYKPKDENSTEHYTRLPLESARLMVGHGVEGDLNGTGNPNRQLNVMSFETLQTLSTEGFKTSPGAMGEQITLRGLDIDALEEGTRIQLGDHAVIEVIKPRTGCDRFEAIQGHLRGDAAGRLGVMARVVVDGVVRVSDPVRVLETVGE